MGLNVLISVFSTMFAFFNSVLIFFVFTTRESTRRNVMISVILVVNIFMIIFTNFDF